MTVKEIVAGWLREHGYDGLWHDECGCGLDDLVPCADACDLCEPGVRLPCPTECGCGGMHIGPRPEAAP